MASPWGAALSYMGTALPKIGYSFDQAAEEKRKRDIEMQDRALKRESQNLQNEIAMENLGGLRDKRAETKEQKANYLTYLKDSQDETKAAELSALSPTERLRKYGLMTPQKETELALGEEQATRRAKESETQFGRQKELAGYTSGLQSVEQRKREQFQAGEAEKERAFELEKALMKIEKDKTGKLKQQEASLINAAKERDTLINAIDDLVADPEYINGKFSTESKLAGSVGASPLRLTGIIPGSKQDVFETKLQNVKDRLSVNARQKLKGSGTISDNEQKMLERSVSILNKRLNKDAFIKELNRLKSDIRSLGETDTMVYGGSKKAPTQSEQPQNTPSVGTVVSGYIFLGGNPNDEKNWKKQ